MDLDDNNAELVLMARVVALQVAAQVSKAFHSMDGLTRDAEALERWLLRDGQ